MSKPKHETINYLEYPATDISATKAFFTEAFGWRFEDYGDLYTAFSSEVIEGGFYKSELISKTDNGAALTVFYSDDLQTTQAKIENAGGSIIKPVFSFPGGRRFHFTEPGGNEFAVWSDL